MSVNDEEKLNTFAELHIFGLTEDEIKERLNFFIGESRPAVFEFCESYGEITVRITVKADDIQETQAVLKSVCGKTKELIGEEFIYSESDPNLQTALVRTLESKGLKIATAESCTGGLVSKRITDAAGASEVFECGICSYADCIKEKVLGVSAKTLEKYTAVSHQTAEEMADGVRKLANADIGISTTGYAGPSGGTPEAPVGTVYIGISTSTKTVSKKLSLGHGLNNERELIRNSAASHILFEALRCAKTL